MNIVEEKDGDLKKVIKLNVEEKDYADKVEQTLKQYRKQIKMPGFRPGHVPMSMVKKMYGDQVLADELNKVVVNKLYEYIENNKIPVLGNPLPKDDEMKPIDPKTQKEFEFVYEMGLAPEFKVEVSEKDKFTKYIIEPDEELIEKQIEYLAKRHGRVSEKETAEDNDMIFGLFEELDENGNIKENGIQHKSTIALDLIEDEKVKNQFTGLKTGDNVIIDPKKVSKGTMDMAAMLNISKKEAEHLNSKFKFTVEKIYHIEPHELNQEFFDKIYGKDHVKTLEEFKQHVKDDLREALRIDSEKKLEMDIVEHFLNKLKLPLPDDFLKRWLLKTNEGNITEQQIEEEYEDYADNLRWQLIENQIAKENNLKVGPEEAMNYTVQLMKMQVAQYGGNPDAISEEELRKSAAQILANEDEAKKIYERIFAEKIMTLIKEKAKIKEKEVTYQEFAKLVSGKTNKFSELFNNLKKSFKK